MAYWTEILFSHPRTQETHANFFEEGRPDQCTKSNSCKSNVIHLPRASKIMAHQFRVHAISVTLMLAFRLVLYF
jgi:hypothetical protein